jgi:hypothetical protein
MCLWCTHFKDGFTCDAFPDGIPDEILFQFVDHRKPVVGDNGIRFESNGKPPVEQILQTYDEMDGVPFVDPLNM